MYQTWAYIWVCMYGVNGTFNIRILIQEGKNDPQKMGNQQNVMF
jgi:hypothetical protein